MIRSLDFFHGYARVTFHDGSAVDVKCKCWGPAASDAEARHVAAVVALQARAAHSPEMALIARLDKLLNEASEVCFRLYETIRSGNSDLWDLWRLLMVDPPPGVPKTPRKIRLRPPTREQRRTDPVGQRRSIPHQVATLQGRLNHLWLNLQGELLERVTFLHVVSAAKLSHAPEYLSGQRVTARADTTLGDVTDYYPLGATLPPLPPVPTEPTKPTKPTRPKSRLRVIPPYRFNLPPARKGHRELLPPANGKLRPRE
ncbi:hypothetical protein [Limnoglobus roseus]|uniref:Uncharacterized protein n=1 Tax=Limnoglobus roseus TaxID=2598579 RepID=A0A5C1AI41_9BACT|nr:hypothetical protein [Limnoglobus roseus]QEL18851.1 hypothetical protein PX52LOC_05892 [Limnoglobus roseus]